MLLPVILLTLLIVLMGVYSEPFIDFSMRAAEQLLNKEAYINAVLNS